ncbi:MAG: hypothetical protein ACI4EC_10295 [Lachnospiraceae bacterium]
MLKKAPSGYYDLILMDIQMPNMNGHLAKPINVRELLKELANILG